MTKNLKDLRKAINRIEDLRERNRLSKNMDRDFERQLLAMRNELHMEYHKENISCKK